MREVLVGRRLYEMLAVFVQATCEDMTMPLSRNTGTGLEGFPGLSQKDILRIREQPGSQSPSLLFDLAMSR